MKEDQLIFTVLYVQVHSPQVVEGPVRPLEGCSYLSYNHQWGNVFFRLRHLVLLTWITGLLSGIRLMKGLVSLLQKKTLHSSPVQFCLVLSASQGPSVFKNLFPKVIHVLKQTGPETKPPGSLSPCVGNDWWKTPEPDLDPDVVSSCLPPSSAPPCRCGQTDSSNNLVSSTEHSDTTVL